MTAGQRHRPRAEAASGLRSILRSIDLLPFPSYRRILGRHDLGEFAVHVDRVPPDPFAGPARVRLEVERAKSGLPRDLTATEAGRTGVEDWVARAAYAALAEQTGRASNAPGTGQVLVEAPGPAILPRSTCRIDADRIELRLLVDLPAQGRRVRGAQAEELFFVRLARLATATLLFSRRSLERARRHAGLAEDHAALQRALRARGLVAFVPNGALLRGPGGEPFASPPSLEVALDVPHAGTLRGMGVPAGVTVIAGASYHGKTTLLEALASGIRPHPPGDGRENLAIVPEAVAVRAEPGRPVRHVDLSRCLASVPSGARVSDVSTEAADALMSEAAAVEEAVEAGARVLLLDEDTSAPALLIRDPRMRALVPPASDSVVPLVDRLRELYDRDSVSTILATGSSGDALQAAHTVILMRSYRASDSTRRAREIAGPPSPSRTGGDASGFLRAPTLRGLVEGPGLKTGLHGTRGIRIGHETVDLGALSQITETGEIRAIAELLRAAAPRMRADVEIGALVAELDRLLEDEGLDGLDRPAAHGLSRPRTFEIAAALCRWRSVRFVRLDRRTRPPNGS
jgi:predicted ABC-class ATPase